jgi:hypothetical protein
MKRECVCIEVFPSQWLHSFSNPGINPQSVQNFGPGKTLSWAAHPDGDHGSLQRSVSSSYSCNLPEPGHWVLHSRSPMLGPWPTRKGPLLMTSRHLRMQNPSLILPVWFQHVLSPGAGLLEVRGDVPRRSPDRRVITDHLQLNRVNLGSEESILQNAAKCA